MIKSEYVLEKVRGTIAKSKHSATNVTEYMGPSLRLFSEVTGQRTKYSGFNWDTRVRSRSAKYTVIVGSDEVMQKELLPEQQETLADADVNLTRVFGGSFDSKEYVGHANMLPIDYVHRVMGSGKDPDFTFNCNFLVTTKNPMYHHIGYMWGKMLREVDPIEGAPDLYIFMLPDINTGTFGRFYAFPEVGVTVGLGSDYMGEVKKGFLRMAMYQAKKKGILGVHAASKVIRAEDVRGEEIKVSISLNISPAHMFRVVGPRAKWGYDVHQVPFTIVKVELVGLTMVARGKVKIPIHVCVPPVYATGILW